MKWNKIMFVCSQLLKQKDIMPKKSSREVQFTKDLDLREINQKPTTKIALNKQTLLQYTFFSFLLG